MCGLRGTLVGDENQQRVYAKRIYGVLMIYTMAKSAIFGRCYGFGTRP